MRKKYLITAVQNATPINERFFDSLLLYSRLHQAELIAIPYLYRNPTSPYEHEEEYFSPLIEPYLCRERKKLSSTIQILGDVSINPTASNPLSGLEPLANGLNTIVAHPQVALKYLATPVGELPLAIASTGSISQKNYSASKAGKKGEFHHSFGAVVLEIDGDTGHVRHLLASSDGSFIDLGIKYSNFGTEVIETRALVMGDLHIGSTCSKVTLATSKLVQQLRPKKIILHDCFDGETVNHHEDNNPFAKFKHRFNTLKEELDRNACVLKAYSKTCDDLVIVDSNHNDFLYRWLQRVDWKTLDTETAKIYLEACLQVTKDNKADVYAQEMRKRGVKARFLSIDESFVVEGVELGFHGHLGSNGSRGSDKQFAKLGRKTIVGHRHCLPGNYLIQTKNSGWKEIKALSTSDLVLSYDWQTKTNTWETIKDYYKYNYDDLFIQIQGNGFEQTFTKEHRLRLLDGSYIAASDAIISRSASELPLSAEPVINKETHIAISEVGIKRAVSVANDGSRDGYRVRFHLKKPRKIQRLKELWGDDLIIYREESEYFDGYVSTRSLSYLECRIILDQKGNKLGRTGCLALNTNQSQVLVDELKHWDGTFDTGSNGRQWSTAIKREANIIQSLLTRLGYSNSRSIKLREGNQNDLFVITWCEDRQFIRSSAKLDHDTRFNGWGFFSYYASSTVYCLSLETKCFWVRSPKTGQVSLTGNSPGIEKGCYTVGTSTTLKLNYTKGLSSWMNTHCLVYEGGKRQLINIIEGKYTND
ncbi:MAG: Hint domain-containing protein [Waterburya sp.]